MKVCEGYCIIDAHSKGQSNKLSFQNEAICDFLVEILFPLSGPHPSWRTLSRMLVAGDTYET